MATLLNPQDKESSKSFNEDVLEENMVVLRSWRILTANNQYLHFHEDKERHYRGPFYFIQGADIQFGFIQNYLEKTPTPGWDKEIALAELAVMKINQLKPRPRFFVMCGDLCDAFPADEPEVRRAQEVDFKRIFGKLDPEIPLVCVCGNHDIGNRPSMETVESYRNSFGDDYFSFWCGGLFFIVLNSQYYHDASLVPELAREQEEWLDSTLAVARTSGTTAVVFQHIPLFISDPDETDTGYFAFEPAIRKNVLERLKHAGVQYVFAGHYHRNAGGRYDNLEMVVTSAIGGQLGADQSGLRVVHCSDQGVRHKYYSLDDFPQTIELSNS